MTDSIDWYSISEARDLAKRLCLQFGITASDIFDSDGKVLPYEQGEPEIY